MADRFPLILNTSANQIQEIASGDTLDLTDVNISNAGVITATSFAGDGSGLIGVASTDNIVTGTAATFNTFPIDINAGMDVAGVSTFAGNIDANGDLDVDGHTNLDNVSVAGVSTFAGQVNVNSDLYLINDIVHSGSATKIKFETNRIDFEPFATISAFINSSGITAIGADINGDLDVDGHTNLDNVSVAGVTTFTGDATFNGNVSIGGTLTYEDVTNIDSVGIVTAREGIFLPDTKQLQIGNAAGSADLKIFHSADINQITTGSKEFQVLGGGSNNKKVFAANTGASGNNSARLYFDNNLKLETSNTGVTVTGTLTATTFSGDGSNLTGVGISTEQVTPSSNVATLDLTKNEHKIVASGTYTIDVNGGTEADSHVIRVENSGISTVGFSTYFKFPSGGTPALPTASGAISLISFTVHKVGSVGIATVLLAGASVNFS